MKQTVIALAGNPNVGKSTLFNAMTGLKQHTGNWTGKTVENAFGTFRYQDKDFLIYDLPGTYSIRSDSPEEEVARNFILYGDPDHDVFPDVTVVVADASLLERNLTLFLQIAEITDRVILCLNLADEAEKRGMKIDEEKLSDMLGCPVVLTNARSGRGMEMLYQTVYDVSCSSPPEKRPPIFYGDEIEAMIKDVQGRLGIPGKAGRLSAIRYLSGEGTPTEASALSLPPCDDPELRDAVVSAPVRESERIAKACILRGEGRYERRILRADKILTSKFAGKAVMLATLCLILWITVSGANYPSAWLFSLFAWIEERALIPLFSRLPLPSIAVSAILDGVYRTTTWVVSVMLPPMAIFFPLFTFLEDVGYLPRIAFNLDRYFRKCGTSGRQSLTVCMGLGCNACGVTGCRIIASEKERKIAVLTNALTPCNGRFPTIITVVTIFLCGFAGVLAGFASALMMTLVICCSLAATLLASAFFSRVLGGETQPFIMELPPYRRPQIGKILVRSLLDRTLHILGRAVCVAAPAGLLIWLFANITVGGETILSHAVGFFDPLGHLMGMDGTLLLGFILGFPANEIVLPVALMGYTASSALSEAASTAALRDILVAHGWGIKTAVCTVIFVLFHFPCATTVWTIAKETKSLKYAVIAFLFPTALGVLLCSAVNLVWSLFL